MPRSTTCKPSCVRIGKFSMPNFSNENPSPNRKSVLILLSKKLIPDTKVVDNFFKSLISESLSNTSK